MFRKLEKEILSKYGLKTKYELIDLLISNKDNLDITFHEIYVVGDILYTIKFDGYRYNINWRDDGDLEICITRDNTWRSVKLRMGYGILEQIIE